MSQNGSLIKTDDLAMAVYLTLEGFEYTLSRAVRDYEGFMRPTCVWCFPVDAGESADLYRRGEARVDPNRFVRTWGVIRREMINYLDVM